MAPLKHLLPLALAALLFACGSPDPAGTDPTTTAAPDPPEGRLADRMDRFLADAAEAGFNGSVLVSRAGRTVLDKGYGLRDREQALPNGPATVHAIGSITKQFTAACILKLQEQGRLRVEDSLSEHLPGVPPDKRGITLHHLLTHSAGFPGAIGDDNTAIDGADFTRMAFGSPLMFAPGTGYEYSNVGYSLLGIVVEHVSGMALEDFLRSALLGPAGLAHTAYRFADPATEELAIGYRKDGTRWGTMLDHPTVNGGPGWHLRGNGGMLSTTHEMAAWVQALHDRKVLSDASVKAMFTPHVEEGQGAGSHYGYGWALFRTPRGTRLITHNGGNGVQFADVLWYADEGVTVVVMSNADQRGMQDLAWDLGRMVFDSTYAPRLPQAATALEGVPDGPVGDRMKALSAMIAAGGDDAVLAAWLMENLGPGFLDMMLIGEHVGMFKRLHADIGAHTIEGVEQLSPEEYVLKVKRSVGNGRFRILLQMRPVDARIAGMGVEME
ncbi:MAG: beta-lactamase family protein [Flavobacteriales bacterium]|nr:beta-lactamase family protein [Flavobacteriales bacterium]MBK7941962.1 beta-lactamase family protein [Flavobacteriales bacterium]MBK9700506.1 beta-lactamase family protein [Flavobacteriales bacterium]